MIPPLDYFSIERSAQVLSESIGTTITPSDIEHWLMMGRIRACIDIGFWSGDYVCNEHDTSIFLCDTFTPENEDSILEEVNKLSEKSTVSPINHKQLTEVLKASKLRDVGSGGHYNYVFATYGVWFLSSSLQLKDLILNGKSTLYNDIINPYTDRLMLSQVLKDDLDERILASDEFKASADIFIPYEIVTKKDIVILYEDIAYLLDMMKNNKKPTRYFLDSSLAVDDSTQSKKRKPRTEVKQSDMIAALLACLPDLKEEIEKAGVSRASETIDTYLMNKELPPLIIGENNYKNWLEKANYKPTEK